MVIYEKTKETMIIPTCFSEGINFSPCEEEIAIAWDEGYSSGYTDASRIRKKVIFRVEYNDYIFAHNKYLTMSVNGIPVEDVGNTQWYGGNPSFIEMSGYTEESIANTIEVDFDSFFENIPEWKYPEEWNAVYINREQIENFTQECVKTQIGEETYHYHYTFTFDRVPLIDISIYDDGYEQATDDIRNNAIDLNVTQNGTYSADTENNEYFKNVVVNVDDNKDKYEVTFYYDEPNGGPNMASHTPDMKINGNDAKLIGWPGLLWAINAQKTTYLYDMAYRVSELSAITSFDITLHIQNGTAPEEISVIRVNGSDYQITSQTREYIGTDEQNFSHWIFHIVGNMTFIPPFDYYSIISTAVLIRGAGPSFNKITASMVGDNVITANTESSCILIGNNDLVYKTNVKFNKFGSIIGRVDNRFRGGYDFEFKVYKSDFEQWEEDWSVDYVWLNCDCNRGGWNAGGIEIPILRVNTIEDGDYVNIQINNMSIPD